MPYLTQYIHTTLMIATGSIYNQYQVIPLIKYAHSLKEWYIDISSYLKSFRTYISHIIWGIYHLVDYMYHPWKLIYSLHTHISQEKEETTSTSTWCWKKDTQDSRPSITPGPVTVRYEGDDRCGRGIIYLIFRNDRQ